jgi:DNA-binding CsgD family transcriptional regulator
VDDGTDGLVATYELACTVNHAWTIGELGLWMHRHGHLSAIDPRAAAPYRLHVEGSVDQAALLWTDLGRPYDAAEAQSDSSDPAEIRNAHAAFLSLGAAPAGARAARRLRELGARSIPRGPYQRARSHPDGLTRREDEVVQLVREGYTDAEIAQTLHLSAKTVSQHVSASLRKLEVTSRRQLIVNRSDDLDDG